MESRLGICKEVQQETRTEQIRKSQKKKMYQNIHCRNCVATVLYIGFRYWQGRVLERKYRGVMCSKDRPKGAEITVSGPVCLWGPKNPIKDSRFPPPKTKL